MTKEFREDLIKSIELNCLLNTELNFKVLKEIVYEHLTKCLNEDGECKSRGKDE